MEEKVERKNYGMMLESLTTHDFSIIIRSKYDLYQALFVYNKPHLLLITSFSAV
jgi:hypothetical protein